LQLIVTVLDAFSSLNLEEDLFDQVVNLALGSLRTADAEDLPLIVKFLLQSATSTNVKQIVQKLRENLQFVTVSDVRAFKPDCKQKGKSSAPSSEALILDAIQSGLQVQNLICDAFLKEIRSLEGESNHKVVDVWLLLIIHANGGPYRKLAEGLLKRKVVHGDFNMALIQKCLCGRGESLQFYFKTLLSVSESLLRTNEVATHDFGTHVYILLFQEFVSNFHRQEV
jgi:Fanconi anemia group D2 protein